MLTSAGVLPMPLLVGMLWHKTEVTMAEAMMTLADLNHMLSKGARSCLEYTLRERQWAWESSWVKAAAVRGGLEIQDDELKCHLAELLRSGHKSVRLGKPQMQVPIRDKRTRRHR